VRPGRGLAQTGRLAYENIDRALTAIQRFALVVKLMKAGEVHILATSAVRDASNSKAFVDAVEATMNARVEVLSGEQEAHFAALGVVAGIPDFTGRVGDLGGGSLELSAMDDGHDVVGETHELGVIRLQDDSVRSPARAREIARERLAKSGLLKGKPGGQFCAIGGTWRSLAKVHQVLRGLPAAHGAALRHQGQRTSPSCATTSSMRWRRETHAGRGLCQLVAKRPRAIRRRGAERSAARRQVRQRAVFGAWGARGLSLWAAAISSEQAADPLLQGAEEISILRSRSPAHATDLIDFTGDFLTAIHVVRRRPRSGCVRSRAI